MNRYDIAQNIPEEPSIKEIREKQKSFEEAGLTEKASQCEADIKSIVAGKSYQRISLKDIYKKLFGHELTPLKADLEGEHLKELKLGALVATPYLRGPRLTENQLWRALEDNSYRFVGHDQAREEFLKRLLPHLKKESAQDLVKNVLAGLEQKKQKLIDKAFIKIEEWTDSTANMELTTKVITTVKTCGDTRLFNKICTAYGSIGTGQCTDTIVLGVISSKEWNTPIKMTSSEISTKGEIPEALFSIAFAKREGQETPPLG